VKVERMMSVLETIAAAGRPVSVAELQAATGLPRPTCYRMLQSLREHGLVDVVDDGRYQLGGRLRRLAMLGWSDGDVVSATAPTLAAAADELRETVVLSRLRDEGVEIIHVVTPSDPTVSYVHPGLGYRPRHACSCAKAILAFSDTEAGDRMLDAPLRAYTEHTKTSSSAVHSELGRCSASVSSDRSAGSTPTAGLGSAPDS
jgi:IclR family acetate operon transcriptional repressor